MVNENITLYDHRSLKLRVRPMTPEDKEAFIQGWEEFSDKSRQYRFLGPKKELSDKEVELYTHPDNKRHFVFVAEIQSKDQWHVIGGTRMIRDTIRPFMAEIAISLIDSYQGQGIGGLLIEDLSKRAQGVGIQIIRGVMSTDNTRIRKIVQKRPGHHWHLLEPGIEEFTFPTSPGSRPRQV